MNILIYTPYLDISGGGEQYLLTFARCMSAHHQVTIVSQDRQALEAAANRFNINTKNFSLIPFLSPRTQLKQYDWLYFVSDGSVPFLPFNRSILLFMSPFLKVGGKSLVTQLKLKFISHVVCFSNFTKQLIDKEFSVNSQLIYPAVTIPHVKAKKRKIILSVGRFTQSLHLKRQDVLIKAFIQLEAKLPGWRLILVGGTEKGSQPLLSKLRAMAKGHRISIQTDISPPALTRLYAQARIYWHATGFGTDLRLNPQKAEHFGISVVEAMGQGAVPMVFNAGGPKEIVTSKSGITWDNLKQLTGSTLDLANNQSLLKRKSLSAKKRAEFFSYQQFCNRYGDLVKA